MTSMYAVKQLVKLAGVVPTTLHGLRKPVGRNYSRYRLCIGNGSVRILDDTV
ncbi:hypothetical protein [Pedobacter sp. V48]|uniref:hypothetical protein n=1 Tax=Pedobacter sp. V48 TaxID=509635 RepID=UPI00137825FF|nr:hypothetical protein [Pedobacter sp. V48]